MRIISVPFFHFHSHFIFTAFERRPELAAWLTMIFIILVIQARQPHHQLPHPVQRGHQRNAAGCHHEVAFLDIVIGKIWISPKFI
jgi:hypothetical protein